MKNYFAPGTAAQRYAHGRPYFHGLVMKKLTTTLGLSSRFGLAIDVGCGTGLSSRALRDLADEVVGFDASEEMLRQAPKVEGAHYFRATAERLPLRNDLAQLMTLCSVFHWLDRDQFLPEARRVLRADGWLVIYDNVFLGQMLGKPEFEHWSRSDYLWRYPTPARDRRAFEGEDARSLGFEPVGSELYSNEVQFSVRALVDYLLTQTNVIDAVEGGREDAESAREWLVSEVSPFFGADRETFMFGGPIACYRVLK